MIDQIIRFETAKAAKSKGFFCGFLLYKEDGTLWNTHFIGEDERLLYSACSQSLLRRWLREEKSIDIEVRPLRVLISPDAIGYTCTVIAPDYTAFSWELGGIHETYEDAAEYGILKAIETINDDA